MLFPQSRKPHITRKFFLSPNFWYNYTVSLPTAGKASTLPHLQENKVILQPV
jgi:hypothetical protein